MKITRKPLLVAGATIVVPALCATMLISNRFQVQREENKRIKDSTMIAMSIRDRLDNPVTPNIKSTKNFIQYRNLEGKTVKVEIIDQATKSLYKAIQKYSPNGTEDIVDIGGFYTDVESQISKNISSAMCGFHPKLLTSIRHIHCSQLFSKLFDIFTAPESEKGRTITVKEYTKMMDAWSSTGD